MAYRGSKIPIPLGKLGVNSDDAHQGLPLGQLIRGINIDLSQGLIQKAPGSKRWNGTALPSGVQNAIDWYPFDGIKRVIAACEDGQLYKFKNAFRYEKIATTQGATDSLRISKQSHFVIGGQQTNSMPRKLFFFSGNDQVQVIEGNTNRRRNIAKPLQEWKDNNYPSFGIIYRNRLFTLGTPNNPHDVFASSLSDQEDFSFLSTLVNHVYPGEGERLITGWIFKKKLFVAKYPSGIYMLNDENVDSQSWFFQRVSTSFGAASAHSYVEGVDDGYLSNQEGTVTALSAAFQLGDVKTADVFGNLRIDQFVKDETNPTDLDSRWALYYSNKKQLLFTYKSPSGLNTDRIVCLDISAQNAKPYILSKDQPNCLFLLKNSRGTALPAYGSSDGYIYTLDDPNRLVGPSGYAADFRTPGLDLGNDDNKTFDFLEIEAEHTGYWDISCDVYIDDKFSETLKFKMTNAPVLAGSTNNCFQLDSSRMMGRQTRSVTHQLHGNGRIISFRFYTPADGRNFKITKLIVYARMSNEDAKG